jgi:hypothetical protein
VQARQAIEFAELRPYDPKAFKARSIRLRDHTVGIGVTSPQSRLSVNGTTSSGGLAIGDSTYTSTAGTVAPTNGAIIQGQVGIGINAPIAYLHVGLGSVVNETNATSTIIALRLGSIPSSEIS